MIMRRFIDHSYVFFMFHTEEHKCFVLDIKDKKQQSHSVIRLDINVYSQMFNIHVTPQSVEFPLNLFNV